MCLLQINHLGLFCLEIEKNNNHVFLDVLLIPTKPSRRFSPDRFSLTTKK